MVLKRKPNSHVVCIDPKKKLTPKKVQSKADLVQELKAVKLLNEALEKEIKENMNTISILKEKLLKQKPVDIIHSGCQTDDADLLFCEKCEFPAETLFELGEHTGEFHTGLRIPCDFCDDIYLTKKELKHHEDEEHTNQKPKVTNTEGSVGFPNFSAKESQSLRYQRNSEMSKCKFCDEKFVNRKELMIHNKKEHKETLAYCWDFEDGTCKYEDDCWFKHETRDLDKKKYHEMFKCKFCDEAYQQRNKLMKHNREKHEETLRACWNFDTGTCEFGSNCWFKHREKKLNDLNTGNNHYELDKSENNKIF